MIYSKRGDTIVEVMIAIIVLGLALGGAFAISNRSSSQTQANHERYQAQLYANEKAELIKADYGTYLSFGNDRVDYDPGDGGDTTLAPCHNADCSIASPQNYVIRIDNVNGGGDIKGIGSKSYNIVVTWDSLVNDTKDRVEILYGL